MSETFEKSQMSESFDVPAGCIAVQFFLYLLVPKKRLIIHIKFCVDEGMLCRCEIEYS